MSPRQRVPEIEGGEILVGKRRVHAERSRQLDRRGCRIEGERNVAVGATPRKGELGQGDAGSSGPEIVENAIAAAQYRFPAGLVPQPEGHAQPRGKPAPDRRIHRRSRGSQFHAGEVIHKIPLPHPVQHERPEHYVPARQPASEVRLRGSRRRQKCPRVHGYTAETFNTEGSNAVPASVAVLLWL